MHPVASWRGSQDATANSQLPGRGANRSCVGGPGLRVGPVDLHGTLGAGGLGGGRGCLRGGDSGAGWHAWSCMHRCVSSLQTHGTLAPLVPVVSRAAHSRGERMAAQHRTPAYCPHGDRLSRLHRGCDWEAAAIVATRLATRALGVSGLEQRRDRDKTQTKAQEQEQAQEQSRARARARAWSGA